RAATPRPVWKPDVPKPVDFYEQWDNVPDDGELDNAFKVQWEMFLRHVAADEPFPHDFHEGAKGVQLAELALQSWAERRWIDVPALETSPSDGGALSVVGSSPPDPLLGSSPPGPLSLRERGNSIRPPSPERRGGQGVRTPRGGQTVRLPRADGTLAPYTLREPVAWSAPAGPIRSRVAY